MVAVAEDLLLKPVEVLGVASEQPVLVHDEHAEVVAGFEQLRRRRIVRGAVRVRTDFLQLAIRKYCRRSGNAASDACVILMVARAVELVRLAVEQESRSRHQKPRSGCPNSVSTRSTVWPPLATVVTKLVELRESQATRVPAQESLIVCSTSHVAARRRRCPVRDA